MLLLRWKKVYNLYDSVHLIKDVQNNLLRVKRFMFPEFEFIGFSDIIRIDAGEILWKLFYDVYEKDSCLQSNLRKAPKINSKTLYPGNNKQNVSLALNVFDETTVAGILSYFPDESPVIGFLRLIQSWWNISNSKSPILLVERVTPL